MCLIYAIWTINLGSQNWRTCQSLGRIVKTRKKRYSYLFLALPETIGSVAWLWARPELAAKIVAGINYEMIGVDTKLVLKQSHKPHSIIDRIARKVLECEGDFDIDLRSFRDGYGNDELVFADPDFDIPMIALQHYPFDDITQAKMISRQFTKKD